MSRTVDLPPTPKARRAGATNGLTRYTRLQVAPGLRTRFDAVGHVLVESPDGTLIDIGPWGFVILTLFSRPVALGDVIGRLEASGHDFLPSISVVNALIEEGALIEPEGDGRPTTGWADPVEHARMLHDSRRTNDYMAAIAAAVQPGDVVLDIGTGTGVLAVTAARAGAWRVYAVEATDIADVAERVFAANGVEDRVTLVRGWSRQIDLPERADVLVAEVIGSEPLGEEILETTLDVRRRLLKPGARLVPNDLTILVRPLQIPEAEARLHAIGPGDVEQWHNLYDIEFRPLLDAASHVPVYAAPDCETVAAWPPVGPPVVLAAIDLASFDEVAICTAVDLTVDAGAAVNAVAMTFRADLHGAVAHTLDPWTWPASSWATSVWVLPEPVQVGAGSALRVQYSRRATGIADGLQCEVVESQRQTPEKTHDDDWRL